MTKACKLLKETLFTNLLHFTYLAHAVRRVALLINEDFDHVDKLISLFQKIEKTADDVKLFQEKHRFTFAA